MITPWIRRDIEVWIDITEPFIKWPIGRSLKLYMPIHMIREAEFGVVRRMRLEWYARVDLLLKYGRVKHFVYSWCVPTRYLRMEALSYMPFLQDVEKFGTQTTFIMSIANEIWDSRPRWWWWLGRVNFDRIVFALSWR